MTFQPEDIKWIKSVTRDMGTDWAYIENRVGDIFDLAFPNNSKWFPKNYGKVKPGELIVLFQSLLPKVVNPEGWYVTHLVTPTDEKVYNNGPTDRPYYRSVITVGITEPARHIDRNEWSFFKPNRGPVCDINTIERKSTKDSSIKGKQRFIWDMFTLSDFIDKDNLDKVFHASDDDYEGEEGARKAKLKWHKYLERDPEVINRAKEKAKKDNRFFCEVCMFNFEQRYPELGKGFIECHHKNSIATGGVRKTKIEDLALVCSNCHKMLHRKYNSNYLSINELKGIIKPI